MKTYGLVGRTLSYSYSKLIHEYLIDKYQVNASYDLIEMDAFNSDVIDRYDGLNITTPYKEDVVKYLDINNSPILVCNTIVKEKKQVVGYNTDINGFDFLIKKLELGTINKVVILGSGATSLIAQKYFVDKEIIVISRSDKIYNYDYLNNVEADLLINTTPIGMNSFESPIAAKLLNNYLAVVDLNYNPLNSKLSLDCKQRGVKFINGLYMLIKQAVDAFKLWHNLDIDNDIIEEIYREIIVKTNNKIAIIGMPLSGKSFLAKKCFGVDLDQEIIKDTKESIEDMLNNNVFRNKESKTLEKLVNDDTKLISLGGGAILDFNNMLLLKDYLIIFLDVPLDKLKYRLKENQRPLLKDEKSLNKMYNERIEKYLKYSNMILDSESAEVIINEIINN